MTSTIKTSVVVDTSALVDGTGADASDVSIPLTQTQTQLRSGQVAVSAADTHVKHLEDAVVAGAGITITKNNAAADEELSISTSIDAITPTTTKGDLLVDDGTNLVRLPVGTNGQILTADSGEASGVKWATGAIPDYVRLSYTVASGTAGGTATSGSWQTRPINTEDSDASGICTLSANEFTLDAGTYDMVAVVAFQGATSSTRMRLYNVTDAADIFMSINAGINPAAAQATQHVLTGQFTIAASKTLRLEYRVLSTITTNGLGLAQSFGDEIYAVVELRRVA